MPQPFTTTGGARIGWTHASWPLAKLSATPDKLTLSVLLLGSYDFRPNQVLAVERYVRIPVLAWGVRISHCKTNYPARIIFSCLGSPERIIQGIRNAGFVPVASASAAPQRDGIAIRWTTIIVTILVWNGLFLLTGNHHSPGPPRPGPFVILPLAFVFLVSAGAHKSTLLQRIILKPGRDVGEIKPFLRLLAVVSGFMLITFTIILVSGGFNGTTNGR